MPYYDPESTYVLWSSLYLLSLGAVGFALAHFAGFRQQMKMNLEGLSIRQNPSVINILKEVSAIKIL